MALDEDWIAVDPPVKVGDLWQTDIMQPGRLIKLVDGLTYLVGEVNTLFGACDCCKAASRDDTVVAYRQVWEP